MRVLSLLIIFAALGFVFLSFGSGVTNAMDQGKDLQAEKPAQDYPSVTLGGGCFWCTESEYRALDGVLFTRVGYMGGSLENPTYQDITSGETGHAEVVEVTYDPEKISYDALLRFFLTRAHDPTQLNRQGVDVGTQYRSAIFYADEDEKKRAQAIIDEINASERYDKPIVTTLEPLSTFWLAEDYHQQYYEKYYDKNGYQHVRVILKKQKKAAQELVE